MSGRPYSRCAYCGDPCRGYACIAHAGFAHLDPHWIARQPFRVPKAPPPTSPPPPMPRVKVLSATRETGA